MSQLASVSVTGRGRMRHVCVVCGSTFSYVVIRTRCAQAASRAEAQALAEERCSSALQVCLNHYPCPKCGAYQPKMFIHQRRLWHVGVFLLGCLALMPIVLGVLGRIELFVDLERIVSLGVLACWYSTFVALSAVIAHVSIARRNLNRDLTANLLVAARHVAAKSLQLDGPAKESGPSLPASFAGQTRSQKLLLAIMAVAALLPMSTEGVRIRRGWHMNSRWYPGVVGPGDLAYTHLDEEIEASWSHWKATSRASVRNAHELGLANGQLNSHAKRSEANSSKYQAHATQTVWIGVQLPSDVQLSFKPLEVELAVDDVVPNKPNPNGRWANSTETLVAVRSLQLSEPGAGRAYNRLFWSTQLAMLTCIVVGGSSFWLRDEVLLRNGAYPEFVPEEFVQS